MGLLDFNVAELVTRSVRALKVRGRVPYTLDDSVVPVIQVFDTTRAPYRLTEQRHRCQVSTIGPVAAEFSFACIFNSGPSPVVVEEIEVYNRGAAVQSLVSVWGAIGGGTQTPFWTSEPSGAGPGAPLALLPQVVLITGTQLGAVVPNTQSPIFVTLQSNAAADNRYRFPEMELVIPPAQGLILAGQAVNTAFGISVVLRNTAPQL